MVREQRAKPVELADGWPDVVLEDPAYELLRVFVVRLRDAIGDRSLRSIARDAGIPHASLDRLVGGHVVPDALTVARLEVVLGPLWGPAR